MTSPLAGAEGMLNAVMERDLDGVLDSFSPAADAYVFVEGPRWTTKGGDHIAAGWRAYFEAPIRITNFSWAEGPFVFASDTLAQVVGIVDYDVSGRGMAKRLRMRMTWLLRHEGDRWRIVHEHGSQPLEDPYGAGDWWPEGATPLPS